jgi:transcriptional regulator with XRE-family HTH domain
VQVRRVRTTPAPNVILGEVIRRLREDRGLSQENLARESGLHPNAVGFIERGERNPGWNSLVLITDALGIDTVELARLYEEQRSRHTGSRRSKTNTA